MYIVSQKLCHYTFVNNFDKYWQIFFLCRILHEICNKIHDIFPTTPQCYCTIMQNTEDQNWRNSAARNTILLV